MVKPTVEEASEPAEGPFGHVEPGLWIGECGCMMTRPIGPLCEGEHFDDVAFYNGSCLHWACDVCPNVITAARQELHQFEALNHMATPSGGRRRGRPSEKGHIGAPLVCEICRCDYCISSVTEGTLAPCQFPNSRALSRHMATHGLSEEAAQLGSSIGACARHQDELMMDMWDLDDDADWTDRDQDDEDDSFDAAAS